MPTEFAQFHFLRPLALLLWIAVPLYWWRGWAAAGARLHDRIDPALRAAVLVCESTRAGWRRRAWLSSITVLAALALAGPAWREEVTPIYQVQAPLVLAVDMSGHMLANDLEPDRLTRTRYKLLSLLRQRQGGQVALIAYAGDAFTVAPMTDDAHTVASLLDALAPRLLPVAGQNPAAALARAGKLIHDAGFHSGEVLLVTDSADAAAIGKAAELRRSGVSVSALGIGSPEGAPLRDADGALVNDARGAPQWARLEPERLAALAAAGGGRWQAITGDDSDLARLGLLHPGAAGHATSSARGEIKRYRDEGIWLLPPLLLLFAFGFRRGGLLVLFAAVFWPTGPARALDMDALWRNREQRAEAAMQRGEFGKAQALAHDPRRIGAAAYRAGDWQAAIDAWARLDDADAHYNRGNALARAGRLDDALAAYDAALARVPGMADALKNRAIVAKAREQRAQQASFGQNPGGDTKDQGAQQQGQGQPEQDAGQSDQSSAGQDANGQEGDQRQSGKETGSESAGDDEQGADAQADAGDNADRQAPSRAQDEHGQSSANDGKPTGKGDAQGDAQDDAQAAKAMQQAIDAALAGDDEAAATDPGGKAIAIDPAQQAAQEQRQAIEMQLRRVPDDPGGLLRQKFWLEYQRRQQEGDDE